MNGKSRQHITCRLHPDVIAKINQEIEKVKQQTGYSPSKARVIEKAIAEHFGVKL